MIRFVDIREADTGYNFSFFDTVKDEYISLKGEQVFSGWLDVLYVCTDDEKLSRYKNICPNWVFEEVLL